ncbi:Gfo/Idh/MocA family oxidoreductase [Gemmata sp. JC673]|uniref:Gfo/Idh/MocA family oxidoreductase n=1 Tax=Gemmata algarum TaxID=2975278 RepID=A0ABU5ESA3_9BACT|nr:Gfo/Idh/MocA family oxidoreductase [Gemmata algarum]MDY3557956.1 Gfo/Idh/MocA family oxidoreductase [Gemmata algarum]
MPTPLDRRKFFGSAAALSLSAASYANVAGSNARVRVGFLGCGGRAQAHIDLVNKFAAEGKPVQAVAVCDVWDGLEDEYEVHFGGKATRRRYAQGLYPSARKCGLDRADRSHVTKDYRVVLDRADVDAVCITTPDHWHGRMTLDALSAGKDVYVERPMTRTAEEAVAVVDAWRHTGRVVTVGVQSMADGVWVRAFDAIRTGAIGHVAHAQTGFFRNDVRGQWRFYRLAQQMTPKTVDWDLFLGHQFECAGRRVGPTPREQPFDRATFAQWRCQWPFSGGPFTDMLSHYLTRMTAAMGVRFPTRVVAGGGLYLETDGRDVPDVSTVVADYDEGCQLVATATTLSGYPTEDVIRGRLGAIKFVKGGFQVFRDDPTRGASFPPRMESAPEPSSFVAVEPPRNDTEAMWVNFLECVQARRQSTFCPPDLGAVAVTTAAMAVESYRTGSALFWDNEKRQIVPAGPSWAERGEQRSRQRAKPNQIFGWSGGDGGVVQPPSYQSLAGPWLNGKDPAK